MTSLILAIVLVLGFLSAPESVFAAAAGKKLIIAYAAMNARVCPLWAPRERGFFAKYGFDAETLFVRGAPTLVAAMASNEIEVGYTGGTAVIGAVASGADLKVLSALTNRVTYDLVARPGIKSPKICAAKHSACKPSAARCGWVRSSRSNTLVSNPIATRSHHRRWRSNRARASAGQRHNRRDRARWRAEPTVAREGISDL